MPRQYGDGSVYQRKSDGRWVAKIPPLRSHATKSIVVTAKTEQDVKRKRDAKLAEINRNGPPTAGIGRAPTVARWAEDWLPRMQRIDRPKTWSMRQSTVNLWIVPTIGRRKLEQLTPNDVRAVHNAVTNSGSNTSTAQRAHRVLIKMLKDAQADGHHVQDRVTKVKPPIAAISDRDVITLADTRDLLTVVLEQPDASRWIAALVNGMRQGECLGLTWKMVKLDDPVPTADVSWQLQPIPWEHNCGPAVRGKRPCGRRFGGDCPTRIRRIPDGFEIRPLDGALCLMRPKTARGRRVLPLVGPMVDALQAWRLIAPKSPHGLIWPRPDGRPQTADIDRAAWYGLQDRAQIAHVADGIGRRYLLHEARHTASTLLLEAGVDESVRIAILGHAKVIRTYEHIHDDLTRAALTKVSDRLELG